MKPLKGDVVVKGKRGLDGFPGTDLESTLVKKNPAVPRGAAGTPALRALANARRTKDEELVPLLLLLLKPAW